MNTPEAQFAVLIKRVQSVLKPLGYKKEGKIFAFLNQMGWERLFALTETVGTLVTVCFSAWILVFILKKSRSFKTDASRRLNASFGKWLRVRTAVPSNLPLGTGIGVKTWKCGIG